MYTKTAQIYNKRHEYKNCNGGDVNGDATVENNNNNCNCRMPDFNAANYEYH